MILLAGFSIRDWMNENKEVSRKFFQRLVIAISLISAIAFFITSPGSILKTMLEIYQEAEFPAEGFSSQLFMNCLILVAILLLVNFFRKRYSLNLFWTLALFITIDLIIQTRLTAPTTLYHGEDYVKTAAYFDTLAKLPSHQQQFNWVPLKLMDETRGLKTSKFLETNVSTYNRNIGSVGENPFRFKAFDVAKDNGMLDWVLQNPLMYFPHSVCMDGGAPSPGCLFQHNAHLDNIGKGCELNEVQVGHNNYSAHVKNPNDSARWLVLSANYHHLWSAEYNSGLLPIAQVNSLCMGVLIPPHTEGEIHFVYESKALVLAIVLSFIAWCFLGYMIASKRFAQ
jgi:hypothetical protein